MELDLELDKLKGIIQNKKLKNVLLQLPDGLKPKANYIIDYINQLDNDVSVYLWFNSCFGACDLPQRSLLDSFNIDDIIQIGHSQWQ